MTDDRPLIGLLRRKSEYHSSSDALAMHQAADLIEAQQREIDALKAENERLRTEVNDIERQLDNFSFEVNERL